MVSRIEQAPLISQSGPEKRWGDRALQHLERWLTSKQVSEQDATFVVEGIWVFYSYDVLPTVQHQLPIAIGVRWQDQARPEVDLYLPSLGTAGLEFEQSHQMEDDLMDAFARSIIEQGPPSIDVSMQFVTPPSLPAFDSYMNQLLRDQGIDYVGIFADDVEAELATIMAANDVGVWLSTPNTLFGDAPPRSVLGTPQDRPLRDLILSVRHGMAA